MDKTTLLSAVELDDAFRGYTPTRTLDLDGWNGSDPTISEIVVQVRPSFVIEVGTWLGQSTATIAETLKRSQNFEVCVLCVDTWLGSLEHWIDSAFRTKLNFQFGKPTLYDQFLSNMSILGHADMVVPLTLPSQIAARLIAHRALCADLIYLDASHDEQDVYNDLLAYWPLLTPNGIIFGDDWDWMSVRLGVKKFCGEISMDFEIRGKKRFWLIKKGDG